MKNRYVVIMAGGKGERFWPQSRLKRPKHLLPIVGNSPMLSQTIERLRVLCLRKEFSSSPTRSKGKPFWKVVRLCCPGGSSGNRKVGIFGSGGRLGGLACGEGRRECGFCPLACGSRDRGCQRLSGHPRGGFCCVGS